MNEDFRFIAEALGMTYKFEDYYRMNLHDAVMGDVVHDLTPFSGTMVLTAGNVYDHQERYVGFLTPTDFDFHSEENAKLVAKMQRKAQQFIATLNSLGRYETISGNVPYTVVYDKFDANRTGVYISFTLAPLEGICEDYLIVDYNVCT